jgi:MOSC domain-containing protein YiiM
MQKLISINVSLPKEVSYKGTVFKTGIFKEPVEGRVMLRTLNLDGDGQADLKNHGGSFRAVYAYTLENYEYWERELGRDGMRYGQFGENLTVAGMPEDGVHIGDVYRVGGAVVQVTQPRPPCKKLGIRMGMLRFPKLMLPTGRVGFYLRVLQEGEVGAGDPIELVEADPQGITVRQMINLLYFEPDNFALMAKAADLEALTPRWREIFADRLRDA